MNYADSLPSLQTKYENCSFVEDRQVATIILITLTAIVLDIILISNFDLQKVGIHRLAVILGASRLFHLA